MGLPRDVVVKLLAEVSQPMAISVFHSEEFLVGFCVCRPRRSYWNEFAAAAAATGQGLMRSFVRLFAASNERGRLLTCNGEAVIGGEAMFAQALQRSIRNSSD